MHFIVMGAGRVGQLLTKQLVENDHTVAVITAEQDLLDKVINHENVEKIYGFGFDPDVLVRAGAQNAFAFTAVTDNDNMNILAVRVAREKFGIEKVVARIYNAKRAEIFERLGIPTVATIRWTTDQIMRHMIPIGATNEYIDPSGKLSLLQVDYDDSWIMQKVVDIERYVPAKVAFLTRFGESILVESDTVLQAGDILHVFAKNPDIDNISHTFSKRLDLAKDALKTSEKSESTDRKSGGK